MFFDRAEMESAPLLINFVNGYKIAGVVWLPLCCVWVDVDHNQVTHFSPEFFACNYNLPSDNLVTWLVPCAPS